MLYAELLLEAVQASDDRAIVVSQELVSATNALSVLGFAAWESWRAQDRCGGLVCGPQEREILAKRQVETIAEVNDGTMA